MGVGGLQNQVAEEGLGSRHGDIQDRKKKDGGRKGAARPRKKLLTDI